jgi:site-specific DNA recombinase
METQSYNDAPPMTAREQNLGAQPIQEEIPLKFCLYSRKSSESEEKQALSVESQIREMTQLAVRENLNIVEIKKESHSAKDAGQRPIFNEIIREIKEGKYNCLLVWDPSRASRNGGDLGILVDLMDQKKLIEIRTINQKFTNSPNEKFLLMILCSQAKLENDNKSINVKRGLRTRCEMGLRPGIAPTGYLNEKRTDRKCHVLVDTNRAHVIKEIYEKVALHEWSGRKIYKWLKHDINFRTKNEKHLTLSNVYIILKNPFYHGRFEYPAGSGNWYTGQHKPLVSRDLFEKVQKQITRNNIIISKSKEFAFTKLMKCGLCGSGVTADEKYKRRKDGSSKKYIYYGCTRFNDKNCKCGYTNEVDLIEQLVNLIDKLSLNQIGMREKIEKEIERYNKFNHSVLGLKAEKIDKQKEISIKNYAKYILKEGSIYEKRELLSTLQNKIILKNKKIYL